MPTLFDVHYQVILEPQLYFNFLREPKVILKGREFIYNAINYIGYPRHYKRSISLGSLSIKAHSKTRFFVPVVYALRVSHHLLPLFSTPLLQFNPSLIYYHFIILLLRYSSHSIRPVFRRLTIDS